MKIAAFAVVLLLLGAVAGMAADMEMQSVKSSLIDKIGYDADAVPAPTSLEDLMGEDFRGKVAINGDPTQAGAAAAAINLVALQNGGSADDIHPGLDDRPGEHAVETEDALERERHQPPVPRQ